MNVAALEIDSGQRRVLEYPVTGDGLAVVGPAGSGKSHVLALRALRLSAHRTHQTILFTSPFDAAVARLRARFCDDESIACIAIGAAAFEVLRDVRDAAGDARELELIDDVQASQDFERAGAELFALEWTEFAAAELDPEITGLRAPERFAAAAFRLIRKLRAALVTPQEFKAQGLRGAAEFYGHPPNFASADLLLETPAKYRDSLRVSPEELERQRAREIDLVKILSRLYARYAQTNVERGRLTPTDAIYEATFALQGEPRACERARQRYGAALVDDAQDLSDGQTGFLRALFGERFARVTFAGDAAQRTRGFAGGARLTALRSAPVTIALTTDYRLAPAIAAVARLGLGADDRPVPVEPNQRYRRTASVELYRAGSQRDEARYVAGEIVRLIESGLAAEQIAVIARNLKCSQVYIDALLARNIPTDIAGSASLYAFPVVLDALAALWSAIDPFRHDQLLRNLEAPWLRLCDASIATLCAQASDAQPLLFEVPDNPEDAVASGRWERGRALRLGRNVTRGDNDAALPADARERLTAFRAARERWERAARSLDLPALARLILSETVLATPPNDARSRFDRLLLARLLDTVDAFATREPLGTLDDFLCDAECVAAAEGDLLEIVLRDERAVQVLDVDASKGLEFTAVFMVDVRAGAWPRYYVPDAFLYSPTAGMVPKDNVGDARTARTAKFTWMLARSKYREAYNREDRRAFAAAATRARERLSVTASGRATRGKNTPEILAELEAARVLIPS